MKSWFCKNFYALGVLLCFFCFQLSLYAQPMPVGYRLIDLGKDGFGNSQALSINNHGQIVGWIFVGQGFSNLRGFIWENGERRLILNDVESRARAINDSGWVTGSYEPASLAKGFLWKDSTLYDLGTLGGYDTQPVDINDHGQIVGTDLTFSGKKLPFIYQNGSIDTLPTPTNWNGTQSVEATAINNNGQVTGYTRFNDGLFHTFIWENNNITELGIGNALVHDINDQGYAIGRSIEFEGGGRWKDGFMQMLFYDNVGAYRINKHNRIIALYDLIWQDGVVYNINNLLDDSANGWSNLWLYDINDHGVIVGSGFHDGKRKAIMLDPSPIKVNSPKTDDLWIVGRKDTIRWEALSSINTVDIWYSVDGGETQFRLAESYPADSGYYVWQIPDELSRNCEIEINASLDLLQKGVSGKFSIKDYELTRIVNNNYEEFLPQEDGWNFANSRGNMWPHSWWVQYNYFSGDDPYTNEPYPGNWVLPDINARPFNFPAWPTFVRAYGTEQLYFSLSQGIYRPSAVQRWRNSFRNNGWGGACSGFAISSIQAFNDADAFNAANPDIPQFVDLMDVPLSGPPRALINQLWEHWSGKQHLQFHLAQKDKTPRETVREIVKMFMDDTDDDQYLYIAQPNGAHAVVPYRISPYARDSVEVFIYDPNAPGNTQRSIVVDTVANTWQYRQRPIYSNPHKIYLMDPVSSYYQNAIFEASNTGVAEAAEGYMEISAASGTNIWITDENGNQIGYADSTNFNQIDDALLLIPPTGYDSPPAGYYLPGNSYAITMSNFTDSSSYLTIVEDSILYSLSRYNVDVAENDKLIYNDGLTIYNPDGISKTIYQETIFINPENERVFDVFEVTLAEGDSLQFKKMNEEEFVIRNAGTAKTYNLKVKQASAQQETQFHYNDLTLTANSTHYIQPVWSNLLKDPVTILIDEGNDGTIDDSMTIVHQPVGIDEQSNDVLAPEAFRLYQNYPNPFNPVTTIRYDLPDRSAVRLAVYNVLGQLVATLVDDIQSAGAHTVHWDGSEWRSGVYFLRLESSRFQATRKMLLLR